MASQKEEHNPSHLFGDAAGDDPFSQIQQQQQRVPSVTSTTTTAQLLETPKVGDASSLFGDTGGADIFFSSAPTISQHQQPPLTTNASSFFEQPNPSESFFDGLGQSTTAAAPATQPAASLTQAYDPNTYGSYDYSQQQPADQQYTPQSQDQQQYDPNQQQWIQFDPNQHFYYDEQGQVHYYDPNTNQEYDMSQYGYDQQAQAYEYQYDAQQYAEYYAQQGYDPNAYATAAVDSKDEHAYIQDNYDLNTYAPVTSSQVTAPPMVPSTVATAATTPAATVSSIVDSQYYQQEYQADVFYQQDSNAVAQVPAQIQSEQTINTQTQQDQYQAYNEQQQQQQQEYQNYEGAEDLQQQDYSQSDIFAEDLQQQAVSPPLTTTAPVSLPPRAMSVVSPPPPPQQVQSIPAPVSQPQEQSNVVGDLFGKESATFRNEWPISEQSKEIASAPFLSQQPDAVVATSQSVIYDADVSVASQVSVPPEKHAELDDLDDLVLGDNGSVKESHKESVIKKDEYLISTADYDAHNKDSKHGQVDQPIVEQEATVPVMAAEQQTPAVLDEPKETVESVYDPQQSVVMADTIDSYEPQQPETFNVYELQQEQQPVESTDVCEAQQQYGTYDPQQYEQPTSSYEPYQGEQAVNYSSYEQANYSAYEPQQGEQQAVDYSSYEAQQIEQVVDYSSYQLQEEAYEPQQTEQQNANFSSYEPVSYQPQQPHEPEQVTTSYAPPQIQQNGNTYEPQQAAAAAFAQPPPQQKPPSSSEPPKQFIASPPFQQRNIISPPPPSFSQRSNSITEPERTLSPFGYQRSSTVPPPERMASPRPTLIACPDPLCEGENKAKAKFCCECGRPLPGISRSTTPSTNLSHDGFSPLPKQRSVLDEKKEAMVTSLKNFSKVSVLVNADVDKALTYMESRVGEFEPSKALLWNVVKLMIQYRDAGVLGDGGELDKSIATLLSSQEQEPITSLDRLETYLAQGDREGACQFAMENDMWAHALIISQNNQNHFKRVISQFIHRELISDSVQLIPQVPGDQKSLRMLYSVFGGATGADAVSELAYEPITKESLQGWQRALSFILANRSSKDTETIAALGEQLKQVGSIYDASLCFALSPDANLESFSLQILGSEGSDIYTDLDALYLSEFYEFALSDKSPQYLQNYKLIHAWWLSDLGFTNESRIYSDSIVSSMLSSYQDSSIILQELKQLSDTKTVSSDQVTSLLNKATFDTLIGSIEEKIGKSQNNYGYGVGYQSYGYGSTVGYLPTSDYSGQNTSAVADTLQPSYGYASYTDQSADEGTVQESSTKIKSPFGAAAAATPVRSPFQHASGYVQTESSGGAWWGSEEQTNTNDEQSYQPYQPSNETSYQPDAYTPATSGDGGGSYDDDEDDLGFGNTKKKPVKQEVVDEKPRADIKEEKPNEKEAEKKEEKPASAGGGWGLFNLFGSRNKDPDEKKAVKANLGETNKFYFDAVDGKWKNRDADLAPPVAATPPPPKTPSATAAAPPPPASKPTSMPPTRINSVPNVPSTTVSNGPPNAATPLFNTPPPSGRRGGAGKKPTRARYVDVLNTTNQ